ncbi:TM2 domain-containing protein [Balneicella halophila]|uniref:TM2 domain-containing protein n=1 Tax=Balneicella halophila TaxID=1537566 RepID=A0A7L4UQR3_BALHA|nr:TM2 domain-containing protein [Balneicella halophila]PVX52009.1 TM2 domain-containing protein [Balneicella halophila]
MDNNLFNMLPGIDYEERVMIENAIQGLTDEQKQKFLMIYQGRRQDSMNILIFTLLGFVGIAGIHRFVIGDIGLGIVYLLTAGLCWIGTIVDLVNYKSITLNYNRQKIQEVLMMMGNNPHRV